MHQVVACTRTQGGGEAYMHHLGIRVIADGQLSVVTVCLQCPELLKPRLAHLVLTRPLPVLRTPPLHIQQPLRLLELWLILQQHGCQTQRRRFVNHWHAPV